MTDTGNSHIIMPEQDWKNLYTMICDRVLMTYSDFRCETYRNGYARAITGPGIDSVKFKPITVQLDDTVYELPFEAWFKSEELDDVLFMRNHTLGELTSIGMPFLELYYQAYDL